MAQRKTLTQFPLTHVLILSENTKQNPFHLNPSIMKYHIRYETPVNMEVATRLRKNT